MFYVKCYVNTLSNNDKSQQLVQCRQKNRGLLRTEVMRELCVELIDNYYFNQHSFCFACASIFYFICILIRLNDVSLNCVVICHALIQYTHLFLKCLKCMIFIGALQNI